MGAEGLSEHLCLAPLPLVSKGGPQGLEGGSWPKIHRWLQCWPPTTLQVPLKSTETQTKPQTVGKLSRTHRLGPQLPGWLTFPGETPSAIKKPAELLPATL